MLQTKPHNLLVGYLMYIKQQLERQPSLVNMDDLRSLVTIATNKGMVRPVDQPIHFTPDYNNKIDLRKLLPGRNRTILILHR